MVRPVYWVAVRRSFVYRKNAPPRVVPRSCTANVRIQRAVAQPASGRMSGCASAARGHRPRGHQRLACILHSAAFPTSLYGSCAPSDWHIRCFQSVRCIYSRPPASSPTKQALQRGDERELDTQPSRLPRVACCGRCERGRGAWCMGPASHAVATHPVLRRDVACHRIGVQ